MANNSVIIQSAPLNTLLRRYNMQNVQVQKPINNPYDGKVNQSVNKDAPVPGNVNYLDVSNPLAPIATNLNLKGVEYTDFYTNWKVKTEDIYFACVLINVSQAKRIVKTEIQGADGTVKEYIGLDDYSVSISGIIASENGRYPFTEVGLLKKMLDAPVAIPVVNPQLNNIGIFNLVVEGYEMPQEAGRSSQQDFSINCISDKPIELQLQ